MTALLADVIPVSGLPQGKEGEAIAALVIAIVGFPLFYFVLSQQRKGRSKQIGATLTPLGFTFSAAATPEDQHLMDGFIFGALYARGWRQEIINIAHAPTSDDGTLVIFDGGFRVDVVPGEKMMGVVAYRFTAARVSHPEIAAPAFLLTPRADADRLKALFPAGQIEFPEDPDFGRQFRLQSHEADAARAYFTPERRAALKQFGTRLELEGRTGHLLHLSSVRLAPSQLPGFIQKTRQLAQLFRQGA